MNRFEIHRAESIEEASDLLTKLDDSCVYAGGTELLLAMKEGFLTYSHLVDIKHIDELRRLDVVKDQTELTIGATVTHRTLESDPRIREDFPLLADVEGAVGNVRVRSSGTIGGNLVFAEPHSDIAAFSVLMGGRAIASRGDGFREIAISDFIVGPFETLLEEGELLVGCTIPLPPVSTGIGYQRFAVKERPLVMAGASIELGEAGSIRDVGVVVAGATPRPTLHRVEAFAGDSLGQVSVVASDVGRDVAAKCDVITDLEGDEAYKRHLIAVLVKRAIVAASNDLAGEER